ncbi:MAG: hypothetical protein JSR32_05595 [Proteobacteria bacterium]|nr:hypothetical protein [Pseudomonadota bacterium]
MANFEVQFADPSFIEPSAQEAAFGWKSNEVVVFRGADESQVLQPDASGSCKWSSDKADPWSISDIRRRVQNVPYAWRMIGQAALIPKVDAGTPLRAVVSARSRLSLWTGLANFTKRVAVFHKIDGKIPSAQQYESFMSKHCGGLDDISLIATISRRPDGSVDLTPELAVFGHAVGKSPGKERSFVELALKNLIGASHSLGIQVTAGYEVRDDYSKQTQGDFVSFITSRNSDMTDHANRIRDVLDNWNFDGVGFDIEVNGIGPGEQSDTMKAWFKQGKTIKDWVVARPTSSDPAAKKEQAAADNLQKLYQTLAQLLITKGRFVSYATAAFVDAKSGNFDDGVYIFGHTRVQPIGLAAGRANMIARIMAYDEGFQAGGGKKTEKSSGRQDALTKRHVQILKSITSAGIHPSIVQLGIKMESLQDFGMKSGHMTVDQAVDRCTDLRRFRTGLITFSGSNSTPADEVAAFARYDKALNESEFTRRHFLGVPFQAPH